MIRPSLVLLTFLTLILGAAAVSEAAETLPIVLAQVHNPTWRGPGMYLNLFKFVPVILIYLMWAWTTDWVEHDTQDLNNLKFATWNSVDVLLRRAGADPGAGHPDLSRSA